MLSGQAGDFRQCIRGFAIALAHTSAQCPRQDLLVGRCSDIHKDQFTQQDAAEPRCARKYFGDDELRISSVANTKGQAMIAWPLECTPVKLWYEPLNASAAVFARQFGPQWSSYPYPLAAHKSALPALDWSARRC